MEIIKKYILPPVFVGILLAIDQFTKYLAVVYLQPISKIVIIEGVFSLFYLENSGMAFGLLQGGRWIFIAITVVVMCFIIYFYTTLPKNRYGSITRFFLLMLIGGALGNFIDRLLHGFVVDFFFFKLINFPVFNMADVFLVVAVFAIIGITIFTKETVNGRRKKNG